MVLLLMLLYLCCLPRQRRNKEHETFELASGHGPFLDGLATFFLRSACGMETILFATKVDVCVVHGHPLWCVPEPFIRKLHFEMQANHLKRYQTCLEAV